MVPDNHLMLRSDWSIGCRWSLQGVASCQGCCYSKDVLLTPPLPQSTVTPPCLIPWEETWLDKETQHSVCVSEYVRRVTYMMNASPVMCGGQFAWGTLQVLLEAKVKGLTDGADDVLGQSIGALQDVTCWRRSEQQFSMSMLHVRYETIEF